MGTPREVATSIEQLWHRLPYCVRIALATSGTAWPAAGYAALAIVTAGDFAVTGTRWLFTWPFFLELLAATTLHALAVGPWPLCLQLRALNRAMAGSRTLREQDPATLAAGLHAIERFPIWNSWMGGVLAIAVVFCCALLERLVAGPTSPNVWVIVRGGLYATILYSAGSMALGELLTRGACRELRRAALHAGIAPYDGFVLPQWRRLLAVVAPTLVALLVSAELGLSRHAGAATYGALLGLSGIVAVGFNWLEYANRRSAVHELGSACDELAAGQDGMLVTGTIEGPFLEAAARFNAAARRVGADRQATLTRLARQNEALLAAQAKLLESDRQKSEFLGMMSHELRTPLHILLGYTHMLLEAEVRGVDLPASDCAQLLGRMVAGGEQLSGLVEDTLSVLRLGAGATRLDFEAISLSELFVDLHGTDRRLREAAAVEEQWIAPPDLPRLVTDRRKLRQVITNLVGNARKFTASGRITVRASQLAETDQLAISVADTGCGIPADQLPFVFDLYRQAANGHAHDGCGLGLYIVRRFVDMLGGHVDCKSTVGHGSTFTVTLPRQAQGAGAGGARAVAA